MGTDEEDRPSSKVARLIDAYDLDGFGDELEAKWTSDGEQRLSLRDCAALFNRRLLEEALLDAEGRVSRLDVETTYERLTGDDVTTGVRTETRNRLERDGVDVEQLQADFVTYQAIRSYLTEYRDATYEGLSDGEKIRKDLRSIQRLQTRTRSVTEERIEKLRDTDRIAIESFEILLETQVLCQECGRQYAVTDLLEREGCRCQGS